MKYLKIIVVASSAFVLFACAQTPNPVPSDLMQGTHFTQLEDEHGYFHPATGLYCPQTLLDVPFASKVVLPESIATSASCNYKSANEVITVTATEGVEEDFQDVYAQNVQIIQMLGGQDSLEFDNERTTMCDLAGLIAVSATPQSDPFSFQTAVFKGKGGVSLLALHPTGTTIFKLRYTGKSSEETYDEDFIRICTESGKTMTELSVAKDKIKIDCKPKYTQVYRPPVKLGGAGSVMQVKNGETCKTVFEHTQ